MPVAIRMKEGLYEAEVTPPHGKGVLWRTPIPMSRNELAVALLELGCHQTDIGDAFYEADPEWLARG